DPATCAGSTSVTGCVDYRCATQVQPSPSACNGAVAQQCGLYPDAVCQDGSRPQCAQSCRVDSQCQAHAYCKAGSAGGSCELKLEDGSACTGEGQCQHSCNHGFCCEGSGPCCGTNDDCRSLEMERCVEDTNSCDGVSITAACSAAHSCVTTARPAP